MNPHHSEEQDSVKPPSQPQLCSTGCGFFANPACSDMCSKCFRDTQARQQADMAAKSMATEVAAAAAAAQAQAASPIPSSPPPPAASPIPSSPPPPAASPVPAPAPVAPPAPEVPAPVAEPSVAAAAPEDDRPVQKHKNRCFECNKKVGLTGFQCRCGYIFCGSHRMAEAHKCTFDYKAMGRERLATNNPQVIASKVDKI